jgi:hypothetical protein
LRIVLHIIRNGAAQVIHRLQHAVAAKRQF